ncbi:MAG: hypothetical protein JO139_06925 [Alphaproteobacteria bacterium]|nr:hypothetical protein [Alphaproteobacteria bacterium]MBV8333885.1 hypothetical protein [Alphaproteobacteria bacterium]
MARIGERAWLIGLCLYGLAACTDFAYHLEHDVRRADGTIQFSEIPVAFSAALFWPVDLVSRWLLVRQ